MLYGGGGGLNQWPDSWTGSSPVLSTWFNPQISWELSGGHRFSFGWWGWGLEWGAGVGCACMCVRVGQPFHRGSFSSFSSSFSLSSSPSFSFPRFLSATVFGSAFIVGDGSGWLTWLNLPPRKATSAQFLSSAIQRPRSNNTETVKIPPGFSQRRKFSLFYLEPISFSLCLQKPIVMLNLKSVRRWAISQDWISPWGSDLFLVWLRDLKWP